VFISGSSAFGNNFTATTSNRKLIMKHLTALFAFLGFAVSLHADCTLTSTGKIPLNELTVPYQNIQGGLYPNGTNNRPAAHLNAGMQIATNLKPLNASGQVDDSNGKIVMVSVGMSNTTMEWAIGDKMTHDSTEAFKYRATNDLALNRHIVIIDCAQSGRDVVHWSSLSDPTWTTAIQRVTNTIVDGQHITPNQVQIAWVKLALANPSTYGPFPIHVQQFQNYLEMAVRNIKTVFPNVKMAFVSTRTRSYSNSVTDLSPEPYAYETGFGVKWMIQKQINGDPSLRFSGPVAVAPYLSWGPYFWIDGLNRRSDGAIWNCDDLVSDFTHPSSSGVDKVSSQLLAFFKTDPTATPWYLKKTVVRQAPRVTLNGPTTIRAGTSVQFSALANDPDGQIREIVWSFDDGDYIWSTNNSSPLKTFFVPGTYTTRVTVTDNDGNTATGTLTTTVH
jgi:PKD domain